MIQNNDYISAKLQIHRDNYFTSIIALCNVSEVDEIDNKIKDIEHVLPTIHSMQGSYNNYIALMQGLIKKLEKHRIKLEEDASKEDDEEIKGLYNTNILIIKRIIELCNEKLLDTTFNNNDETLQDEPNQKIYLIFAHSDAGNIFVEKDLKGIPAEFYSDILTCLEDLQNGVIENNDTKAKSLSQDKELIGLHEVKKFQIRIVYRKINESIAFIMIFHQKKDDFSHYDRIFYKKRMLLTKMEYNWLLSIANDSSIMERMISEGDQKLQEIINYLKSKGRKK